MIFLVVFTELKLIKSQKKYIKPGDKHGRKKRRWTLT